MMTDLKYTTLAAWTLAISRALEVSGVDPEPILKCVGLDLNEIENSPEDRISIELMTRLWRLSEEATGNPAFGFEVAKQAQPMHFRALGLLFLTCDSLAQAIQKLADYYVLVSNSVLLKLERKPDQLGFIIEPLKGIHISELAIDAFFATVLQLTKQVVSDREFILKVDLQRSKPEDIVPWKDLFGCEISFKESTNCLWMDRTVLENTLILGDKELAAQNEAVVKNYLGTMNALSWSERVKHILHSLLLSGEPSLASIADVLNLSERTLSRYLKEEGVSFRSLLQEKQKELAHYFLVQTNNTVNDIALKLGFSDSSNFNRAFQRWNGCSPTDYRNKYG